MKKLLLTLIILIATISMYSCTSSSYTDISGTWTKPGYTGKKFSKILVVAISEDRIKRGNVESAIVKELNYEKFKGMTSETVIDFTRIPKTEDGKVDSTKRGEIIKMVTDAGCDGAIVVSLLDIKEKTSYVPGSTYYQPTYFGGYGGYYGGYYGGFYGYAYNTYNVVSTPGYYVNKQYIYLETRLFDIKNDELVWAAKSESVDPTDLKDFSNKLAYAIVNTLKVDNIVK